MDLQTELGGSWGGAVGEPILRVGEEDGNVGLTWLIFGGGLGRLKCLFGEVDMALELEIC